MDVDFWLTYQPRGSAKCWRPRPELNRGKRFCRPLRNHSATWPQRGRYIDGGDPLRNAAVPVQAGPDARLAKLGPVGELRAFGQASTAFREYDFPCRRRNGRF